MAWHSMAWHGMAWHSIAHCLADLSVIERLTQRLIECSRDRERQQHQHERQAQRIKIGMVWQDHHKGFGRYVCNTER